MNVRYANGLCFLSNCRHVKGRVLVALADGTLAIFHRSEGIWNFTYLFQEGSYSPSLPIVPGAENSSLDL